MSKLSIILYNLTLDIGRKFSEKRKATLKRQSSFNGHWYDRDTSVFTPPKDSYMSVWTTSLTRTPEVVKMLMEKYQIQIDNSDRFALFVVKDNGGRIFSRRNLKVLKQ